MANIFHTMYVIHRGYKGSSIKRLVGNTKDTKQQTVKKTLHTHTSMMKDVIGRLVWL